MATLVLAIWIVTVHICMVVTLRSYVNTTRNGICVILEVKYWMENTQVKVVSCYIYGYNIAVQGIDEFA